MAIRKSRKTRRTRLMNDDVAGPAPNRCKRQHARCIRPGMGELGQGRAIALDALLAKGVDGVAQVHENVEGIAHEEGRQLIVIVLDQPVESIWPR